MVTSNGVRLAGSVVFGDVQRSRFSSALPLVSSLLNSAVYAHVASNQVFFTGIAIVNPNASSADVTIEVYDADGLLLVRRVETIPAGQRRSRLLTEYFPSLLGQNRGSGYIKLSADRGIATFALFGAKDLSSLSAIPPQTVP
jgi:hypothetical protein